MASDGTIGDSLIPVINTLQDIFSQVSLNFSLDLPQIAVVGSQSSGKSSVLEALVGRDFLPRGPEICTRRPLLLRLVKTKAPAPGGAEEWGEFRHSPGKLFTDFDRIRQEILAETERVTGTNKGVSDKPIGLTIYSPNVLTMTLVDLPGSTKVPVGDQPANIEQQIRDLVYEYIRSPACIILAVSPANVDLANSDSLQMAQTVDPQGVRTIGVVTKLDIMDRGTNAVDMLAGRTVPLRLGYVGVVLRSQQDVQQRRSMVQARQAESAFFASHPEYQEVSAQCGITNLARHLNAILMEHIAALLPGIRRRLEGARETRQQELKQYGEAPPSTSPAARGALLLGLLSEYTERFGAMLQGRSEELPTSELAGGARIRHVFQEVYVKGLRELNPGKELTDEDIRTAIKNSSGVSGSLLIPQEPFEILVRRAISRLLPQSLQCKELVHEELLRIALQACPPELKRFPVLEQRLREAVGQFILQGAQPAEQMIRDLVACEHDYINTDNPDFIGGSRAVKAVMEQMQLRKAAAAAKAKEAAENGGKDKPPKPATSSSDGKPTGPMASSSAAPPAPVPRVGLKALGEAADFTGDDVVARNTIGGALMQQAGSSGAGGHLDGQDSNGDSHGGWFSWFSRSDHKSHDLRQDEGPAARQQRPVHAPKPRNEQEEAEVEVIRLLVASYFDIVRKTLQDQVPKAIMHFLVHHSQRGLQQFLITSLYKEELFEDLVRERENIVAKRGACLEVLGALKEALGALEQVHLPTNGMPLLPGFASASGSPLPSTPQKDFFAMSPPAGLSFPSRMAQAEGGGPPLNRAAELAKVATTQLTRPN